MILQEREKERPHSTIRYDRSKISVALAQIDLNLNKMEMIGPSAEKYLRALFLETYGMSKC